MTITESLCTASILCLLVLATPSAQSQNDDQDRQAKALFAIATDTAKTPEERVEAAYGLIGHQFTSREERLYGAPAVFAIADDYNVRRWCATFFASRSYDLVLNYHCKNLIIDNYLSRHMDNNGLEWVIDELNSHGAALDKPAVMTLADTNVDKFIEQVFDAYFASLGLSRIVYMGARDWEMLLEANFYAEALADRTRRCVTSVSGFVRGYSNDWLTRAEALEGALRDELSRLQTEFKDEAHEQLPVMQYTEDQLRALAAEGPQTCQ